MTELVTFGETMLRYAPPPGERFETAASFSVHVGGAESNVAVAASRLGCEAVWVSKLRDSPLGRRIERTLRGQGITPDVVWTDEGRQGVYYLEPAGEPRGTNVLYDRTDAAITTATAEELPTEHLESADVFYTSGITPALSEALVDATTALLEVARETDTTTAFDVNYRSKLWSPAEARETLSDVLELVDILVVADRDAATVFGRTGDPETVGRWFLETYAHEVVVVTCGERGAVAVTDEAVHEQATFESDTHDPVGTGDAFVGGFLTRWVEDGDVAAALECGTATAAVKRTIEGDMALVSPAEIEAVLEREGGGISR
jgi:2-dehydro-3-deoxygluconokinase